MFFSIVCTMYIYYSTYILELVTTSEKSKLYGKLARAPIDSGGSSPTKHVGTSLPFLMFLFSSFPLIFFSPFLLSPILLFSFSLLLFPPFLLFPFYQSPTNTYEGKRRSCKLATLSCLITHSGNVFVHARMYSC